MSEPLEGPSDTRKRTVRCGQDDNLMVHAVMAEVEPGEVEARAGRAHQGAHRKPAVEQLARHRRADKTARAGDQDFVATAHGR